MNTLLKFANRAEAMTAIGDEFERRTALNVGGDNEESIRVITTEAVYDDGDPTTLVSPAVLAPGFFCWLWGIPVPAELQAHADAAAQAANGAHVEPVVLGDDTP
jgi:hypothetical protein